MEMVALFAEEAPEDLSLFADATLRIEARLLTHVPAFAGPQSQLALLLTPEERGAAATARSGLLLRCDVGAPSAAWRLATIAQILKCHELGAVAIVLPAARKVIGPSALSALASKLSEETGRRHLFLQFHLVQDDQYLWSHTHGMAHYGLPDLECYTTVAESGFARRLLEGGIAHLLENGPEAFEPGSVVEITQPDGEFVARLQLCRARPVEGHGYDAWGALELVPLAGRESERNTGKEQDMDARLKLTQCLADKQRAIGLDLQGAELAGLDLSGLSADELNLSRANLRDADMKKTRFGDCQLNGAQIQGSDWSGATLRMCSLDGVKAAQARFDGSRLEDSSAEGADFSQASLRNANLSETSFARAILQEAVFESAKGHGVVFRGANLRGASLFCAQFEDADFRGADLHGVNFAGGFFRHADFRGALLEGANFDSADCTGAYFDEEESPRPAVSAASAVSGKESLQEFDAMLQDLARQLETGDAPQSEFVAELMKQAGAQTGEIAPEQAAMLRQLLDNLRKLETPADAPEEVVKHCQELLQGVLPQLRSVLREADWEALSRLLSRAQATDDRSPPPAK